MRVATSRVGAVNTWLGYLLLIIFAWVSYKIVGFIFRTVGGMMLLAWMNFLERREARRQLEADVKRVRDAIREEARIRQQQPH